MAPDPNLPCVKRAVAFKWMREQSADIQAVILENLPLTEQVRAAYELATKHEDYTALLLMNEMHAQRLYRVYPDPTDAAQKFAISDVLFALPEFQDELEYGDLDNRTAEELKEAATHSRNWNFGLDRPSADTKFAVRIPLHNREAWPAILMRLQHIPMAFVQCNRLRNQEDLVRYLKSSRPMRLLEVLVDLVGAQPHTAFAVAPYTTFCTSCLLSKFFTPAVPCHVLGGGGKICKDCLGPELEHRYIPLTQLQRFMAKNEFNQNGMVNGSEDLSYSKLTATGELTEKYTLILRQHASVITQKRFGRNFDDVMYLLDNGKVLRDVRRRFRLTT